MATYVSRNISIQGKMKYDGSAYSHEGKAKLIDLFGNWIMHGLGLTYLPSGETDINLYNIPHLECGNVNKIGRCTHISRLNETYIKLLESVKQAGAVQGPLEFDMRMLIEIKLDEESADFICTCKSGYTANNEEKLLIDPSEKFSFSIQGGEDRENTSDYYITSFGLPGNDIKNKLRISLFPYTKMKKQVSELAKDNMNAYNLIPLSQICDIMSVCALDRVTGFSEFGEKNFEEVVKRLMGKNKVIGNMMDGCLGLQTKKKKLSGSSPTRPS